MSTVYTFNIKYGEGQVQDFKEMFLNLTPSADLLHDVGLPQEEDPNAGRVTFRWTPTREVTIFYKNNAWEITMNSNESGTFDLCIPVIVDKAHELGVQSIRFDLVEHNLRSSAESRGYIYQGVEQSTGDIIMEAPVQRAKEYTDWLKLGSPSDKEPEWRKNLD